MSHRADLVRRTCLFRCEILFLIGSVALLISHKSRLLVYWLDCLCICISNRTHFAHCFSTTYTYWRVDATMVLYHIQLCRKEFACQFVEILPIPIPSFVELEGPLNVCGSWVWHYFDQCSVRCTRQTDFYIMRFLWFVGRVLVLNCDVFEHWVEYSANI